MFPLRAARCALLALTLLLPPGRSARAQQGPSYRVSWWDGAWIAGAGALAVIPEALDLPHGASPCPCDPATVWTVDRSALHTFSAGAGTASNALLVGVVGVTGFAAVAGRPAAEARGNAVVMLDPLAWTAAATEWLKVAAHRSRPVLYTAAAPAAATDPDNRRSFPSGHTALAFAAATSYLVIAQREHRRHATRNAVLAYAAAAGVGALRVAAGKHFPTDVAAGALVGGGIGWLAATVHR